MIGASMTYVSNAALVYAKVAAKQRQVLFKAGAGAQKIMRDSIRRSGSGRSSTPGQPPLAHIRGGGGLKYIRFDVDTNRGNVVIGVVRSVPKQPRVFRNRLEWYRSAFPVPKLLNRSGVSQKTTQWRSGAVVNETLHYHQYPISSYTPTQRAVVSFFHRMIAIAKL